MVWRSLVPTVFMDPRLTLTEQQKYCIICMKVLVHLVIEPGSHVVLCG